MSLRDIFKNTDNVQKFKLGTTIFAAGTQGNLMYVIFDGEVDVWVEDDLIESLGPGEIVGEMSLIDMELRSATVMAKSDCRLMPIDEKDFLLLIEQTPLFSLHIMRTLVRRLRKMDLLWNVVRREPYP